MIDDSKLLVERVQTGVRMEKRLLKVLKAFAEYHDMTLGDLLEGIVLHAFDGKIPFSAASLERIQELKRFYDFDLDSSASHRLKEIKARPAADVVPRNRDSAYDRQRMKTALTGLQWTLGLVILIEAILFVMPGAVTTSPELTCRTSSGNSWVGARSSVLSCC